MTILSWFGIYSYLRLLANSISRAYRGAGASKQTNMPSYVAMARQSGLASKSNTGGELVSHIKDWMLTNMTLLRPRFDIVFSMFGSTSCRRSHHQRRTIERLGRTSVLQAGRLRCLRPCVKSVELQLLTHRQSPSRQPFFFFIGHMQAGAFTSAHSLRHARIMQATRLRCLRSPIMED